jgi:hypothetical protein
MKPSCQSSSHERPARASRRRGFAVLAALVCLLIVVSIVGAMIQGAIRSRRQMHVERDRRQCEQLLVAGAARAMRLPWGDPNFAGDVWQLQADEIAGNGSGRVTCELSPTSAVGSRQLLVIAEYPTDRDFPIRRSQSFQIPSDPTPLPLQEQ